MDCGYDHVVNLGNVLCRPKQRANDAFEPTAFCQHFFKLFFFNISKRAGVGDDKWRREEKTKRNGDWNFEETSSFTLPVLFSTQIAFFLGSIQTGPARTALKVEGGVWRRPGPSLRDFDALEGIGRSSVGIISPGMTNAAGIVSPTFFSFFLFFSFLFRS